VCGEECFKEGGKGVGGCLGKNAVPRARTFDYHREGGKRAKNKSGGGGKAK